MPSSTISFFFVLYILFLKTCGADNISCHFESIYQFGDSILDTGNLIRINPKSPASHLPYGETYFHRPTGRFSNGLLMIDFIAMAFQLPILNPYLDKNASFDHGVNFAVAGSTSLDSSFFAERNVPVRSSNVPLNGQLKWFKEHLNSLCHVPLKCDKMLRKTLVFVGEIGGNDYNYAFNQGKSIEEVKTYVPHVVNVIINTTREVIRLGATRIVIPGNFPIGCIPDYLTNFQSDDPRAYDGKGCLKSFNEFALHHNNYLQRALTMLRYEFYNAIIHYADYYSAFQSILHHAPYLGFDQGSLLKACCGIGGRYNYNATRTCGSQGVPVCSNPARYIHWDGVHLTQEAYNHISRILVRDLSREIQCS